jgi:cytochrome c-type biogenesis protein CcmH/NrfG
MSPVFETAAERMRQELRRQPEGIAGWLALTGRERAA